MKINLGLKGKYTVTVRRPDGTETRQPGNLITDQGLFWLNARGVGSGQTGAGNAFDAYCHLSTDATAPDAGDTTMASRVASRAVDSRSVWVDPDSNLEIIEYRSHYEFPVGAVSGTIAKVGVGPQSNGNGLCSSALIVDGVGAPDPIVVTSADTVTVDYAVEVYIDSTEAEAFSESAKPGTGTPRLRSRIPVSNGSV